MPSHKTVSSKIAIAQRVLIALIVLIAAGSAWMAVKNHLRPAKEIPDLAFTDTGGTAHKLSDFKGQVVVLNLWATWCAPCVKEKPSLDALQAKYREQGLTVVSLAMMEKPEDVKRFFEAHGVRYLAPYLDEKGMAFRLLGVSGLPTTLVLDRQGREVYRAQGAKDWQKQPMSSVIYDAVRE